MGCRRGERERGAGPEQSGQPLVASVGLGIEGRSAACIWTPRRAAVADGEEIRRERGMLRSGRQHDAVVAHEGASVQQHAQDSQNADPPTPTHDTTRLAACILPVRRRSHKRREDAPAAANDQGPDLVARQPRIR